MAQATRETLLDMAMGKTSGGRNNAGAWLAQQLRDNNYSDLDAETIMLEYAASAGGSGQGEYTEREAMATLKEAYSKPAREPWTTGKGNGSGPKMTRQQFRLQQAQRKLNGIPPKPPADPDQDKASKLKRALNHCRKLEGTPGAVYLESRGVPLQLAIDAGSAYCKTWTFSRETETGTEWMESPAVVFCIRDDNIPCNIIAAQGRRIEEWEGINKKTTGQKSLGVFATKGALNADPVAITEAPIDALSLALVGLPAIATCGKGNLPPWLITRLAKRVRPGKSRTVYLAFDADGAGDTQAADTESNLSLVKTVRLRPEGGKDWNAVLTTKGRPFLQESISKAIEPANTRNYVAFNETPQESQPGDIFGHPCMVCKCLCTLREDPNPKYYQYHCKRCGNKAQILRNIVIGY